MQSNVQFTPCSELSFAYFPNKHLVSNLKMTNLNDYPIVYKFKASSMNRFVIKPSQGVLKATQSIQIQIVLHKDGVRNYENQKIQVVYGKSYQDSESKFYTLWLDNYSKDDRLNLTVMVEEKEKRVNGLRDELGKLEAYPTRSANNKTTKNTKLSLKTALIVVILGFLLGFFSPVRLFRKNGPLSFLSKTQSYELEQEV